jgi:hypothetical protein
MTKRLAHSLLPAARPPNPRAFTRKDAVVANRKTLRNTPDASCKGIIPLTPILSIRVFMKVNLRGAGLAADANQLFMRRSVT